MITSFTVSTCLPIESVSDNGELTRVGYDIATAPSEVYVIGASLATVANLLDIAGFEGFGMVRVASLKNDIVSYSIGGWSSKNPALFWDGECRQISMAIRVYILLLST